jgi:hypothetical protein
VCVCHSLSLAGSPWAADTERGVITHVGRHAHGHPRSRRWLPQGASLSHSLPPLSLPHTNSLSLGHARTLRDCHRKVTVYSAPYAPTLCPSPP